MVKKYVVLVILFILPIAAYVFFSMSTNFFKLFPVWRKKAGRFSGLVNLKGEELKLEGKLTLLGFSEAISSLTGHMLTILRIKFMVNITNFTIFSSSFYCQRAQKNKRKTSTRKFNP